jgi:transposase-like protein
VACPSSYPRELRERAIRMVAETKGDYPSEFAAIESVARKLGIGSAETLRKWIRRAEVDAGQRTAARPNQLWVADFTYCPSWAGWFMWRSSSTCSPAASWAGVPPPR